MSGAREIPLSRGMVAIVDEADYHQVSAHRWHAHVNTATGIAYAARSETVGAKRRVIFLHRALMQPGKGLIVDHRSGDTMDCRRDNLRVCTRAQNNLNRTGWKAGKTSRFKGVCWFKPARRWAARYRDQHLGYSLDEEAAARLYDVAALADNAEFALLNFPAVGPTEAARRAVSQVIAPPRRPISRHKGVDYRKREQRWRARHGQRDLGLFSTEDEAAACARAARLAADTGG